MNGGRSQGRDAVMVAERVQARPTFFIVGAPKCGTTSLADFLGQHPDVFMPEVKEPHDFGRDLTPLAFAGDTAAYLRSFAGAGARRCGEASTWYLYASTAAEEIRAFAPDARIVVMFRDPVDVVHALHSQMVFSGEEPIHDFAEAMRRRLGDEPGATDGPGIGRREALNYRRVVAFAPQLARYLRVFGRDRLHVIIFDDFVRDAAASYREVLSFLALDAGFEPDWTVRNRNKVARSPLLGRTLARVRGSRRLKGLGHRLLSPQARSRIVSTLHWLNAGRAPRPPIPPALRRTLRAEFAPGVRELEQLLQRDLSAWRRDEP